MVDVQYKVGDEVLSAQGRALDRMKMPALSRSGSDYSSRLLPITRATTFAQQKARFHGNPFMRVVSSATRRVIYTPQNLALDAMCAMWPPMELGTLKPTGVHIHCCCSLSLFVVSLYTAFLFATFSLFSLFPILRIRSIRGPDLPYSPKSSISRSSVIKAWLPLPAQRHRDFRVMRSKVFSSLSMIIPLNKSTPTTRSKLSALFILNTKTRFLAVAQRWNSENYPSGAFLICRCTFKKSRSGPCLPNLDPMCTNYLRTLRRAHHTSFTRRVDTELQETASMIGREKGSTRMNHIQDPGCTSLVRPPSAFWSFLFPKTYSY